MVTPARFERATYRLGIWRSILLSYGATASVNTGGGATGLPLPEPIDARTGQFVLSGGTTGKGKGITDTPSSTSAFASATLA